MHNKHKSPISHFTKLEITIEQWKGGTSKLQTEFLFNWPKQAYITSIFKKYNESMHINLHYNKDASYAELNASFIKLSVLNGLLAKPSCVKSQEIGTKVLKIGGIS